MDKGKLIINICDYSTRFNQLGIILREREIRSNVEYYEIYWLKDGHISSAYPLVNVQEIRET